MRIQSFAVDKNPQEQRYITCRERAAYPQALWSHISNRHCPLSRLTDIAFFRQYYYDIILHFLVWICRTTLFCPSVPEK